MPFFDDASLAEHVNAYFAPMAPDEKKVLIAVVERHEDGRVSFDSRYVRRIRKGEKSEWKVGASLGVDYDPHPELEAQVPLNFRAGIAVKGSWR